MKTLEDVNPEMRETLGFPFSKWQVCQTRENRGKSSLFQKER